jgi:hypothetical protein
VPIALGAFVRAFGRRASASYSTEGYNGVRLTLARYLALALEFQIGADIPSTAIAPIRTALNCCLGRQMRDDVSRRFYHDGHGGTRRNPSLNEAVLRGPPRPPW